MNQKFIEIAKQYKDEIVQTASEIIQINSQSTHEGKFAQYTVDKMKALGYDEVVVDEYGSVFGTVKALVVAVQSCSTVIWTWLMKVIPPNGNIPHSGKIAEGRIWGRGI